MKNNKSKKGLSKKLITRISKDKNEPQWMLDFRLEAYEIFKKAPMPEFGPDLGGLNFDEIVYYVKPEDVKQSTTWEDVPEYIKETFEKLGIPKAERKALAGVGAQYESEVVYHNLKEEWKKKGIIYDNLETALQIYPGLVKKYFGKCLNPTLHKFMALHYSIWSGGTFLYIPKGVNLSVPVQSYFRMNTPGMGQFEHTLIVAEDDSEAHYIEGCSAPRYDVSSLHSGGVEVFVGKNSKVRYSSVENWSKDVYNLNTKRAIVEKHGMIEWVTGNIGSKVSMIYPSSILKGDYSKSEHVGVSFASDGQIQDLGAKVIHIGKYTTSNTVSKALVKDGGENIYRGEVHIGKNAYQATSAVRCDSLVLDGASKSDTFPLTNINNGSSSYTHEASVGKISEDKLFYLMSRGVSKGQSVALVVNGFISPVIKQIPLEYAVEINRLIEIEMEEGVRD